jgi:NADH-quinone oxidoreductase subunit C
MSSWPPTDEYLTSLGQRVVADNPGAAIEFTVAYGELNVVAEKARIVDLLANLRDAPPFRFHQLILLSGADYPQRAERFDVVYHLLSLTHNHRIRITVRTDEDTPVPSITGVYPAADWYEREAFDMYGVFFSGHPDLRRILTDYGFHGYPLRKDFPMTGYVEVRYDDEAKRVVYEPVKATEWRDWDFLSPWEGAEYARPGEGYPYKLPGDEKAAAPKQEPKP